MSYQIALSALQAINSQLDTISQNIANTGTTGYKSSRTNFSAMYSSSAPNGVRASSTTQTLDMSGGLLSTGRNLDVAIAGKGYFMVKDSTGVMNYTRVGVFDVDKQGYVVDHMGRQVQGYAQQPGSTTLGALGELKVPTGQIPAKASSSVDFVGNLSADWVRPWRLIPNSSSYNSSTVSVVYDSLGRQHTITQYFVKTANNEVKVHYQNENNAVGTSTLRFTSAGQLDMTAAPAGSVINPVALARPVPTPCRWPSTTPAPPSLPAIPPPPPMPRTVTPRARW
jgi:flagellar hook protein FlgE